MFLAFDPDAKSCAFEETKHSTLTRAAIASPTPDNSEPVTNTPMVIQTVKIDEFNGVVENIHNNYYTIVIILRPIAATLPQGFPKWQSVI